MPASLDLTLPDEAATQALGAALASALRAHHAEIARQGCVLALEGDLGAGKTTLVRALLRALGVTGAVKSPTFTLVEPYTVSRLDFYHFDFYRFTDPAEFSAGGFRDYFGGGRVCAVEWPGRVAGVMPPPDLTVALALAGAGRRASLTAGSALGHACLAHLAPLAQPARRIPAPPAGGC